MIRAAVFRQILAIDEETLEVWTASRWLMPEEDAGEPVFSDADAARGRFIVSLQSDMGVNDEAVGLILDLVDQIHGLRGTVTDLMDALAEQPEDVRRAVAAWRRIG